MTSKTFEKALENSHAVLGATTRFSLLVFAGLLSKIHDLLKLSRPAVRTVRLSGIHTTNAVLKSFTIVLLVPLKSLIQVTPHQSSLPSV